MTFQRKLLFGFSLMVLPALLVGAEAIRSNVLERRALQALGQSMARTRTYAELETAMFDQSEMVWRHLSGLDPTARNEFKLTGEVVDYWQQRWRAELGPNELAMADGVAAIQRQIVTVADSIFSARRCRSPRLRVSSRADRAQGPAPAGPHRNEPARSTAGPASRACVAPTAASRKFSQQRARTLVAIILLAIGAGLAASWLISRGLARPVRELTKAMAVVGSGRLEHPIAVASNDEVGDLARAFAGMTQSLNESRAQLVQAEKLASIGEMSAAVAHGLRNPLASLRAAAQLVRKHPSSPTAGEHLDAILEEVDRLDRRISHLLSFSRPAPFHPMPESLQQIVDGILPAVAAAARAIRESS